MRRSQQNSSRHRGVFERYFKEVIPNQLLGIPFRGSLAERQLERPECAEEYSAGNVKLS